MAAGSKWYNGQQWDYGACRLGRPSPPLLLPAALGCVSGVAAAQCTGLMQPRRWEARASRGSASASQACLPSPLSTPSPPHTRTHVAPSPHPAAVFDVDAEEGAPPRKLALNRGDNPYLVADRWLEEQGLPTSYK